MRMTMVIRMTMMPRSDLDNRILSYGHNDDDDDNWWWRSGWGGWCPGLIWIKEYFLLRVIFGQKITKVVLPLISARTGPSFSYFWSHSKSQPLPPQSSLFLFLDNWGLCSSPFLFGSTDWLTKFSGQLDCLNWLNSQIGRNGWTLRLGELVGLEICTEK